MDERAADSAPGLGEDFVFRFPLNAPAPSSGEDPLVELVRGFLEDFLRIGVLMKGHEKVDVDRFAFVCEPERTYQIFPDRGDTSA